MAVLPVTVAVSCNGASHRVSLTEAGPVAEHDVDGELALSALAADATRRGRARRGGAPAAGLDGCAGVVRLIAGRGLPQPLGLVTVLADGGPPPRLGYEGRRVVVALLAGHDVSWVVAIGGVAGGAGWAGMCASLLAARWDDPALDVLDPDANHHTPATSLRALLDRAVRQACEPRMRARGLLGGVEWAAAGPTEPARVVALGKRRTVHVPVTWFAERVATRSHIRAEGGLWLDDRHALVSEGIGVPTVVEVPYRAR